MTVCNRCGKENQDHYKFCLGCGAELTAAPKPGGDMAMMKTMMQMKTKRMMMATLLIRLRWCGPRKKQPQNPRNQSIRHS
mgnify:CR=1 FL=1